MSDVQVGLVLDGVDVAIALAGRAARAVVAFAAQLLVVGHVYAGNPVGQSTGRVPTTI